MADLVSKNYHAYVSETVPWAKFYFRKPPPAEAGLVELKDASQVQLAYADLSAGCTVLDEARGARRIGPRSDDPTGRSARRPGWSFWRGRALPRTRTRAHALLRELTSTHLTPDLRARVLTSRTRSGWLASAPDGFVCLVAHSRPVELQPKAMK